MSAIAEGAVASDAGGHMIARGLKLTAGLLAALLCAVQLSGGAHAAMSAGCTNINAAYGSGITVSKPADSNVFQTYSTAIGEVLTYNVTSATGGMALYLYAINGPATMVNASNAPASDVIVIGLSQVTVQTGGNNGSISFSITCAAPNADLSSLDISSGTLSPSFAPGTTSYTASVANSVTSITLTPTVDDPTSTVEVNGSPVTSGVASQAIPLSVGANTIRTFVTTSDGNTTKTYTVTVTRAASTNADLSGIALTSGTLSPAFAAGTTSYTASVASGVSTIRLTPTAADTTATIKVNGATVASGNQSSDIALNFGTNTITTVVTAEDGTTTKSYTVTVTRALSSNADLSALTLSSGTLLPSFASGTTGYNASVPNGASSITFTPTSDDANATVTIEGVVVPSGTASGAIALDVGVNYLTVTVTAQDGTTRKYYTFAITREESSNSDLSNLTLSEGTLSPGFDVHQQNYTASVANSVTSLTVTPTVDETNATVTVNGAAVTSGSPSGAIALAVGVNTITTVVTAPDTSTRTYTVTVTRAAPAASGNADLSALTLSHGTPSPTFAAGTTSYSASVANTVASLTVTPTVADPNATVTVNGATIASGAASDVIPLNVGANTITTVVTAQDGSTSKTYTIVVTRQGAAAPTISFTPASGALPLAMAGEAYTAGITTTAKAANVPIFSLSAGALPPGVTLNVSTGNLTGPLAAASEGDYSFTISVADEAGGTGSAAYTLKVVARAITAANKTQDVQPGTTPPNVYLNSGATGGPFNDAKVVTVSPPEAGTATIIQGELAAAAPSGPFGYYLKFAPAPGFKGEAKVSYVLLSGLGTSNTGTVTYNVAFDPGAVAADVASRAKGFVKARQNLLASTVKTPGLVERRRMARATDGVASRANPNGESGVNLGVSTSLAELRAARSGGGGAMQALNVWVDGTLMAHQREESGGDWGSFGLVSVGADYLLSPRALVGVSLHFDRMTDPTDGGSELTGDGWLAGPYASLEVLQGVFFDASLLYGGSSNDIETSFVDGSFDTTRWIGTAKIAGQWQADDSTTVTPRLKAVYLSEEVDAYSVANGVGDSILLEGFSEEQLRISIGADLEKEYLLGSGLILSPSLGFSAGFAALDNSGAFGQLTTGVRLSDGLAWDLDAALVFDLEGSGDIAAGGKLGGAVRF